MDRGKTQTCGSSKQSKEVGRIWERTVGDVTKTAALQESAYAIGAIANGVGYEQRRKVLQMGMKSLGKDVLEIANCEALKLQKEGKMEVTICSKEAKEEAEKRTENENEKIERRRKVKRRKE